MHYSQADLSLLIRSIQTNTCEHRAKWWADVRTRRRRNQGSWDARPIADVFKTSSFVDLLLRRAITFRIQTILLGKGLSVDEAFMAFNVRGSPARAVIALPSTAQPSPAQNLLPVENPRLIQ